MREARFILPNRDNGGIDLGLVHRALRYHLAQEFGGYTTQAGTGGWLHNGALLDEPVTIYDVAGDSAMLRVASGRTAHNARRSKQWLKSHCRAVCGAVSSRKRP